MSNSWLKYVAIASVVLAVVLGVIAYRWTTALTESAAADEARRENVVVPAPTTLAVVALRPLGANRTIGPDDVALKPVAVVPERYFTQVGNVIGKVPLIDIDPGAPVTPRYFRQTNILARIIPAGHQAMSLEVSDVVAVGGFVKPGDEVDLLLYVRSGEVPAQARILLAEVLVLAYEDRVIERPQGLTEEEGRPERRSRVRTAVVAVPEDLTTKVMLAASLGDIRLALRRQVVDEESANAGLPVAAVDQSGGDEFSRAKAITLAELTALKAKKAPKAKPPPAYTIQVFRGSQVNRVTD